MSIPAVSVMALYLLAVSVKDIINKKISFVLLAAGMIPVITCITVRLCAEGNERRFSQIIFSHALGLVIGAIFILISSY